MSPPYAISVIVPTYNVAWYLRAFLESLETQTHPLSEVELLFVDDGSTDGSQQMIGEWIARSAPHARVVTKPNGGLSSARNFGLERVTGTWVNFCDPDDVLAENYFATVFNFIKKPAAAKVHLIATRLMFLEDESGAITDNHPLRSRFKSGTQVIDLDRHPDYIHLSAATGFYRRSQIEAGGLRFDGRIKPNFEDAHLTTRYLARFPHPRIAFLDGAHYHYRRRSDGSSLVQSSWGRAEKYTDLLRYGHLDLLRRISEARGDVPVWAQNVVLYDLMFYFREDEKIHAATGGVDPETATEFHSLVKSVLKYVEPESIYDYHLTSVSEQCRKALVYGVQQSESRPDHLNIIRIDADKQIAQVRYYYAGNLPEEEFRARGYSIHPVHAKTRSISYLNQVLVHERILWLPATGSLSISLDGRRKPLRLGRPDTPKYSVGPTAMWRNLTSRPVPADPPPPTPQPSTADGERPSGPKHKAAQARETTSHGNGLAASSPAPEEPTVATATPRQALPRVEKIVPKAPLLTGRVLKGKVRSLKSKLETTVKASVHASEQAEGGDDAGQHRPVQKRQHSDLLKEKAASKSIRDRYGKSWVFIDRDVQAQDNAEHLYRYVSKNHPEINSWFVLDRESADWERLSSEGFRLVPHGSDEHILLLLNCIHLISSQIDHYIVRPLDTKVYGWGSWRFTFLQHGVTKDDLSRWINGKPISLLVTASSEEFDSIAGDGTPYIFTTKEVSLTGFPRHDRLLSLSAQIPESERNLLLVMPTWRRALMGDVVAGGNTRALKEGFLESRYAKEWLGVLTSDRLRKIAGSQRLQVTFVPHPNMQDYLAGLDLPDHVSVRTYKDSDIQELLARGATLLTDYSSLAFEMAYIQRPVVYFQFDAEDFFSGGHAYRKGRWDYEGNGFGPVTTTSEALLDATGDAVATPSIPSEFYAERMQRTFPHHDGRCCKRVYEAIISLNEPIAYDDAYRHVVPLSETIDVFEE